MAKHPTFVLEGTSPPLRIVRDFPSCGGSIKNLVARAGRAMGAKIFRPGWNFAKANLRSKTASNDHGGGGGNACCLLCNRTKESKLVQRNILTTRTESCSKIRKSSNIKQLFSCSFSFFDQFGTETSSRATWKGLCVTI